MKSLVFVVLMIVTGLVNLNLQAQSKDSKSAAASAFADKSIVLPIEYEFDKSVKMELLTENKKAGEKSQMIYVMRYHQTNNYIGMSPAQVDGVAPDPQANVIIDFERMHMITFMNTESSKMAFVYSIGEDQMASQDTESNVNFKQTGEEKVLFGFTCYEYEFSSKDANGTVWAAPELDISLAKSFEALGLQFEMGDDGQGNDPNGFIIEFDLETKSTGEHTQMHVLEVNMTDDFQLNTEGFVPTYMAPAVEESK